jgi:hypothetical protein
MPGWFMARNGSSFPGPRTLPNARKTIEAARPGKIGVGPTQALVKSTDKTNPGTFANEKSRSYGNS